MGAVLFTIIIPAYSEETCIGACLTAILEDDNLYHPLALVVVVNGSSDRTAAIARGFTAQARARNIAFQVLETPRAGKARALDLGDSRVSGGARAFIDADVICAPGLIAELAALLDVPRPRFASGTIIPLAGESRISRWYARFWTIRPFVADDVCGCGLHAVNAAGRQRWGHFPEILSDDKYVKLHVTPDERVKSPLPYHWPVPQGLRNLIRVRSRWCRGNRELALRFPEILDNDQPRNQTVPALVKLIRQDPVSAFWFVVVFAAAKLRQSFLPHIGTALWERAR